ncbi:hypothetical protein C6376_33810 [Streptomyces sp. P3]|nr:hypothetical protein C6376_33810 [Streptomyces sp. P3]
MSTQTPNDFAWTDTDRRAVGTARLQASDAVRQTGNGHPGTAVSRPAPVARTIFQKVVRHGPAAPERTVRDRFVPLPGGTSLTLRTRLRPAGREPAPADLKRFRVRRSKTPGHPAYEHPAYGHTAGVETTNSPLGRSASNAVGMAMAARYQRAPLDPDARQGECRRWCGCR